MTPPAKRRTDTDREDVESTDGTITWNYLQQPEPDVEDTGLPDTITTDPFGITTG